jgi:hypothetical protein
MPGGFSDENTVAENKSTMKFSSVATALGSKFFALPAGRLFEKHFCIQ